MPCEDTSLPAFVEGKKKHRGHKHSGHRQKESSMHEPVSFEAKLLTYSSWCSNLVSYGSQISYPVRCLPEPYHPVVQGPFR